MQHPDVTCDRCNAAVQGTRWKCGHCVNYDLCEACHAAEADRHAEGRHAFIELRQPVQERLPRDPLLPPLYTPPDLAPRSPVLKPIQRPDGPRIVRTKMLGSENGRRRRADESDDDF